MRQIIIVPFLVLASFSASGCGGPSLTNTPEAEKQALNQGNARAQNAAQIKALKKANKAKSAPASAPAKQKEQQKPSPAL